MRRGRAPSPGSLLAGPTIAITAVSALLLSFRRGVGLDRQRVYRAGLDVLVQCRIDQLVALDSGEAIEVVTDNVRLELAAITGDKKKGPQAGPIGGENVTTLSCITPPDESRR